MANQDYGEVLCRAVDEIVNKRLEGISYDKTILCTVVDDTNRETGIYIVSNSTAKFEAVSNDPSYRKNDNVYVQIPGGDWNQQKTIISKKNNKAEQPFIYKKPFESLVDITGNLIDKGNVSAGLLANNKSEISVNLWHQEKLQAAYTRLGIQAGFKSLINPFYEDDIMYVANSGEYGLRLTITAINEKTSEEIKEKVATYVLELNCADMNGNPYDYQTFYTQEKVFDISQIGKIQSMSLDFYQKAGTFISPEGKEVPYKDFLGNLLPSNLFVNDPYISLGYDVNDFNSEMVYIYTLDSTTYSSNVNSLNNNNKNIQLRWIHKLNDGSFASITKENDEDMDYEIRWYKYKLGSSSADEYSGVYWENFLTNTTKEFNIELIPDITLQEEQIKAIIIYNNQPYRSNILVCRNEDEVINKATIDALQALSINCEDDSYGNYRIYGQNGSLLDSAQHSHEREWRALFKSSIDGVDAIPTPLVEAESIEWIVPTKNTMIEIDDDFLNDSEIYYEDNDDARLHIVRKGVGDKGNDISSFNSQKYRIGAYYSQTFSDNTIQCKIVKNGITYTGIKELTFGVQGTSGTDCTFVLDFDEGIPAMTVGDTSAITIIARLYDYENKERTEELSNYEIEWSWKVSNDTINIIELDNNNKIELIFKNDSPPLNSNYNILQATIKEWADGFNLIAYLPIPIRSSKIYSYISGATQVIYDSDGQISNFYKNPYIIYNSSANEIPEIKWSVINDDIEEYKYTPTIITDKNNQQYLKPLSFYVEDACEKICVIAKENGKIVWSQPLLILQNKYPSAMVNKWDGALDVGITDPGTILAPRLVAGKKNNDNTFSGVMIGNWGETDSDNSLTSGDTGLYGFDHGEQSYAFKQDGTAFIGKIGKGRIVFDGENSVIRNQDREDPDTGLGTYFDLDNGIIDIRGDNSIIRLYEGSNSFFDSTYFEVSAKRDLEVHPLISVGKDEYFLQTYNWSPAPNDGFDGQGTKIDLNNGSIKSYNFDLKAANSDENSKYLGSAIRLSSSGEPFFRIWHCKYEDDKLVENLPLVSITNEEFLLQSHNWNGIDSGLQLDMTNGTLKSFNFKLEAQNSNSGIIIGSDGDPYLRIVHNENMLVDITENNFLFQSQNWVEDESGMQLDMVNGRIRSFGFDLKATIRGLDEIYDGSSIRITDGRDDNPFFRIWYRALDENGSETANLSLIHIGTSDYLLQSQNWKINNSMTQTGKVVGISGPNVPLYLYETGNEKYSIWVEHNSTFNIISEGTSRKHVTMTSGKLSGTSGWLMNGHCKITNIEQNFGSGTQLDMAHGILTMLSDQGKIVIESTAETTPFYLTSSNGIDKYFAINWDGSIVTTKFDITTNYITLAGIEYSPQDLEYSTMKIMGGASGTIEQDSCNIISDFDVTKSWSSTSSTTGEAIVSCVTNVSVDANGRVTNVEKTDLKHSHSYSYGYYTPGKSIKTSYQLKKETSKLSGVLAKSQNE